jgi:hypothetical protein
MACCVAGSSKPVLGSFQSVDAIQLRGFVIGTLECHSRPGPFASNLVGLLRGSWRTSEGEWPEYSCFLESAEEGDWICILLGGLVPYVLRPCDATDVLSAITVPDSPQCYFIGEFFLGNVMDGEAMDLEDIAYLDFVLR